MLEAIREVYLKPGDFCFGEGNLRITTVLGSCISIILWHPLLAHGGMCHYMLPSRNQPRGDLALDGKYGDEAMELFMLELKKRRTAPGQYRVDVYGGGDMFEDSTWNNMSVGKQNIEMANRLIDEYGFSLARDHLGQVGRRRIAFDVWSGEVRMVHVDHRKTGS
ncbi:MAG: chemotaxis protein CheD [Nitrosomonadales bacterium]|nr:chemotaxis protein CheD [Nitrosomonadales bacterium]